MPNLGSLGGLGGLVASQLNLQGNTSLEKIERTLGSRLFGADMVKKNDLLPALYEYSDPNYYNEWYDSVSGKWRDGFRIPNYLSVGNTVRGYLQKSVNRGVLTMTVSSGDSAFSHLLLDSYITHLNLFLKKKIEDDAEENIDYLQNRLSQITDPLLREKVQSLIAVEVEKMMVVSSSVFEVVDPIFMYVSFRQKKLYPLLLVFGFCCVAAFFILCTHIFRTEKLTEREKKSFEEIKDALLRIP